MSKNMERDGEVKNTTTVKCRGAVVGRNGYWPIRAVDVTRTVGIDDWGEIGPWIRFEGRGLRMRIINGGIRVGTKAMDEIVAWYLGTEKSSPFVGYLASFLDEELEGQLPERDKIKELLYEAIDAFEGGAR